MAAQRAASETGIVMVFTKYIANGQVFQVDETLDRVTIKQSNKSVVVGFSHSRAWHAALSTATKK